MSVTAIFPYQCFPGEMGALSRLLLEMMCATKADCVAGKHCREKHTDLRVRGFRPGRSLQTFFFLFPRAHGLTARQQHPQFEFIVGKDPKILEETESHSN